MKVDLDCRPLEEFSGITYDDAINIIIEKRKNLSSDIEELQSKRMRRLEEEPLIMKKTGELSYRQTLVHFDIRQSDSTEESKKYVIS